MLDWEDQELADVIWGQNDDHIVPYPEEHENTSQLVFSRHGNNRANEEHANSKPSAQRPHVNKTTMLHERIPESNGDLSYLASNPELKCIGKGTDLEKVAETSKDQNGDKEFGSIIGSSWDNIGIFDDLDRILSNDVLGDHASFDNTNKLWTTSTYAEKPAYLGMDSKNWGLEPLGNLSDQFAFNTEYMHGGNQSYASVFENPASSTSYTQETLDSGLDKAEIDVANPNVLLEKTSLSVTGKTILEAQADSRKVASKKRLFTKDTWSRTQSKHALKSDEISKQPQGLYGTWLPHEINVQQLDSQFVPELSKTHLSSTVLDQENMPDQSTCLPNQPLPYPYLTTYSYGNLPDQCTSMSVLPGTVDEHLPALSSERVSMDTSTDTPIKNQKMTPQEKVEKLRKRQKMRALLAIKKQQQQLSNSAPIAYYSTSVHSSKEDQELHLARADFVADEDMTSIDDHSSPLKQDGCTVISVEEVAQNVEDTALYQLQNVVTKLDMNTRLCIRDSLFRLAQSAMQRNYSSNQTKANRNGGCESDILKENILNQESFIKMPNAETETNSIDRAVAHLLFHQPYKPTSKHTGPPVSSISPNAPSGLEMDTSSIVPMGFGSKHRRGEQQISTYGFNGHMPSKEPQKEYLCKPTQIIENMRR